MKIINLFIKIANEEEMPKKIKYNNIDYFWCNQCKIYERVKDGSKDLYNDLDDLNDEVEILEEEKKIPEKITINDNGTIGFPNGQWTARNMDKAFAMKINEIIDYLKSKGDE